MSKRHLAAALATVGFTTTAERHVDEVTAAIEISDSRPLLSPYRTREISQSPLVKRPFASAPVTVLLTQE